MNTNLNIRRPKILQILEKNFDPPLQNKIFKSNTPSTILAVAEFEPMGGVLIAYPGTIAPPKTEQQLPFSGPRSFGIPDELIIRMQQLDSCNEPVHIFIMCDQDSEKNNKVLDEFSNTAKTLSLKFDPKLVHFVPWDPDTFWTRDYGPWWVETKDGKNFSIAKHIYTSLGGGAVGIVEGN